MFHEKNLPRVAAIHSRIAEQAARIARAVTEPLEVAVIDPATGQAVYADDVYGHERGYLANLLRQAMIKDGERMIDELRCDLELLGVVLNRQTKDDTPRFAVVAEDPPPPVHLPPLENTTVKRMKKVVNGTEVTRQ